MAAMLAKDEVQGAALGRHAHGAHPEALARRSREPGFDPQPQDRLLAQVAPAPPGDHPQLAQPPDASGVQLLGEPPFRPFR